MKYKEVLYADGSWATFIGSAGNVLLDQPDDDHTDHTIHNNKRGVPKYIEGLLQQNKGVCIIID